MSVRARPSARAVMEMQWRDLLFLHWEYPVAVIQATLPAGLQVDTFGGKAYLGVVPFFMRNVRPRFVPSVPRLSHFMELNLRTYVHDEAGVPGVWFYSLDANQPLAVKIARRFFHLPYEHAVMESSRTKAGAIRYRSLRAGAATPTVFEYAAGDVLPEAAPGSLEFFLVERYRLYASAKGRLRRGAVSIRRIRSAAPRSRPGMKISSRSMVSRPRAGDRITFSSRPGWTCLRSPKRRSLDFRRGSR